MSNIPVESAGGAIPREESFGSLSEALQNTIKLSENLNFPGNPWHQLIILGNGFDLECGLHSRFADFEKERLNLLHPTNQELNASNKSVVQYVYDKGLTVWDVILQDKAQNPWSDIELAIEQWVTGYDFEQEAKCSQIADILNRRTGADIERYLVPDIVPYFWATKPVDRVVQFLYGIDRHVQGWDPAQVAQLLFVELGRLERAFSAYLSNEVKNTSDYAQKAERLLGEILMRELPNEEYYDVSASVLDFNYTNPLAGFDDELNPYAGQRPFPTLVNVHGSLKEDNIIFGIDGTNHMNEPDALPFTKTYRLLSLDNPDISELFWTRSQYSSQDTSTDMIKFYGHSLSEADYSYFQAIFDGVDLYESHTRLIFFYRPWKTADGEEISDEEARTDLYHKVVKLLSTYGDTMDNKSHGKNLMHKLLMEGRLSVERI